MTGQAPGRRRVAALVAAAALLGGLSGCMTIDADLHVAADDTLSGTMVLAADRSVLTSSGITEQQFLDTLDDRNRTTQIPARGEASVEPYLTERHVGNKYVYHRVPLRDFSAASGDWRIQHVDDRYLVSGELDFSGGVAPGADQAAMADAWDVTVRITFPGEVRSANGKVDGETVVWRPKYGQRTVLAAEAEDGSGVGWWVYALAGAGGGVLAAGVALVVLSLRRRSARP
jgi:hypothetical protein